MDYSLFFDETFHDRKITINPKGIINTMTDNKNDAYIGLFWGCEKYRLPGAVEKLEAVENKYSWMSEERKLIDLYHQLESKMER